MTSEQQKLRVAERSDAVNAKLTPPTVSVVIPFYNRELEIPRTLKSVLGQTFEDWEIILVDDGSRSDPTSIILSIVPRNKVQIIRMETNVGVSAARNVGIRHSRGQFIAFLDSDDEWHPSKLQDQVNAVLPLSNPAGAICLTATQAVSAEGISILPNRPFSLGEDPAEYLYVHGGFFQTSSMLISTHLARSILFTEHLNQYEDHFFFISSILTGASFVYLSAPLSIWWDEERANRLSRAGLRQFFESGARFTRAAKGTLGSRARLAFNVRYVGLANLTYRPIWGLWQLVLALVSGLVTPKYAAWLVTRKILGDERYERLRGANRLLY